MPFLYWSGEEVKEGDRVVLHGEPGHVETVADPSISPDDYFVKEHGGGVMIVEPKIFGRLFINEPHTYEDLDFVSRAQQSPPQIR
ncbi:MAG TPA: hypothetical protein VI756_02910 [Blastocatellia bacterium]